MNFKFKIIDVNEEGTAHIRYLTDIITEEDVATYRNPKTGAVEQARTDVSVTLPVPLPTGDALIKLLAYHVPEEFLQRLELMKLNKLNPRKVCASVVALKGVTTDIPAPELPDRVLQKGLDTVDNSK